MFKCASPSSISQFILAAFSANASGELSACKLIFQIGVDGDVDTLPEGERLLILALAALDRSDVVHAHIAFPFVSGNSAAIWETSNVGSRRSPCRLSDSYQIGGHKEINGVGCRFRY